MTSQPTQIQALINQIDAVLGKAGPGVLWGLSSEAQQQRAVLLQTRAYLIASSQPAAKPPAALNQYAQAQMPAAESAQQVLQAVMQEMSYLRTNVMQPLRSDLEDLQQQRSTLQQEVQQLEAQRQQYRLPPINQQLMDELLQTLTARIQERLATQIRQINSSGDSTETDQLVLKLDSSLRVMFESLQADLQSYQRSLSASLDKMHTLGQQSEAMFAALISRLAQQLGREASGYLRPGEGADMQIDRLLSELGLPNTIAGTSDSPQLSMSLSPDLLNVDLEPLNLPPTPAIDEEITLFQVDPATAPTDEDVTLFQVDAPPATPAPAEAELDNFYESLFGDRAVPYDDTATDAPDAPDAPVPPAAPQPEPPLVDLESLFADAPVAAEPPELADAPPPPAPQSLESFLFTPEPAAEPASEPASAAAIDSIASLSDLIDQTARPAALSPEPELVATDSSEILENSNLETDKPEDTYIPAPPEEDLLVGQESVDQTGLSLQLDDDMLQQLSADLSNLEGLEPETAESTATDDLSLEDLFASTPTAAETPSDLIASEAETETETETETEAETETETAIEPLDLFDPTPDAPPSDAELRDLLEIHTPPDSPPDLPPDAPPPSPVPPPDLPPDLPIPPSVDRSILAADVDDLFPLTVTPPISDTAPAELPVAVEPAPRAGEAIEPLPELLEPVSAIEPLPELAEPTRAIEPSTESTPDLSLADLFAESPSLSEVQSEPVDQTVSLDEGLRLEDLFTSTAAPADAPADNLTIDLVQLPAADPIESEVFDAAELEQLFAESEAAPTGEAIDPPDEPVMPTIEEQTLLGDLLFDTPELPEPLAPEEAGLTLDSFTDSLADPMPAAIKAPPIDPPIETPIDPVAIELAPAPYDLAAPFEPLTIADFLTDPPAAPEPPATPEADIDPLPADLPPEDLLPEDLLPEDLLAEDLLAEDLTPEDLTPEDLTPEDNAFSLEGLDRLFEDAPEIETASSIDGEKKNAVAAESFAEALLEADSDWIELPAEPNLTDTEAIDRLLAPLAIPTLGDADAEEDTLPLEPAAPDPAVAIETTANQVWSLGLDIGTTGISAVLLNRLSCELFPIYWAEGEEKTFRLPTRVYCSEDGVGAIASRQTTRIALTSLRDEPAAPGAKLLQNFKPDLRLGIPHYSPQTNGWEPIVQWSDQQTVSLSVIHQGLQTLLVTLSTQRSPVTAAAAPLSCGAVGLETGAFQIALQQLTQVIVGYPINCPDTYSLNIREAVLGARLVALPEQVCFVEDAIAAILSGLRGADGRAVVLPSGLAQKSQLHNTDWQGGTLAISAGAIATEFAIVDLPTAIADGYPLGYSDFSLRSLAYAGNAIDQDIVCQLLYPARFRQPRRPASRNLLGAGLTSGAAQGDRPSEANWQTDPSLGTWENLALSALPLPLPGEPDPANRLRLQQHLESSALGQNLLEAARHLKLILQHQDQFALELGDQQWRLTRQDLGSQVILPYIQRLNRELNALLNETGMPLPSIQQVICTGGTASLRAIARWLRQKLPNATIIQDTYARAGLPLEARSLTCSRIAYGLATLPLHPAVLDLPRQQYSDYFLLLELLRSFPDQPLTVGAVMQLLERRGINTQACHGHILALLEGHLPPGLVPTQKEGDRLALVSRQNPEYAVLLSSPLFHKLDQQTYQPNPEQWHRFQEYLSTLLASTHQTLAEPLTLQLV